MAPSHDQSVQRLVDIRFDEQSRFDESGIARTTALPFVELTEDDAGDAWMHDSVKAVEFGAVGKNNGGEFVAINAPVGVSDDGAEFADDFGISGLARFDKFVGQGIGVEHSEAHITEHGGNRAFAAGDSAGEAESEHVPKLPHSGGRLCGRKFRRGAAQARRFHRVAHEHGDGHGADAAGNGRERASGVNGIRMNVANERAAFSAELLEPLREIVEEALSFGSIGHAISANINDGGGGHDPFGLHEAGFAHGGHDDVWAAHDAGKIARFRMADSDCGVGVHEQKRHGLANDVAASENDGVGALDLDIVAAQDFHAAGRSASDESRATADEAAEIHRMKAVHVFGRIDGFKDALGVYLWRKRKLHEDAVHIVVAIQVFDNGEQVQSRGGSGRREERAGEADFFACGDLAFDIKLRSGVFSHENGSKTRAHARRGKEANFVFEFGKDLVSDFRAVEDAHSHASLAFALV